MVSEAGKNLKVECERAHSRTQVKRGDCDGKEEKRANGTAIIF